MAAIHCVQIVLFILKSILVSQECLTSDPQECRLTSVCRYCIIYYVGECLYNTEQQLFKRLRRFCQYPEAAKVVDIKKQVKCVSQEVMIIPQMPQHSLYHP